MSKKVLFILKRRPDYDAVKHSHIGMSTGLYNSAKFMDDMLQNLGVESKLSVVEDYNKIDRECYLYKPTHCIIEAVWVVPEKFQILQKLHPNVTWIIRIHSEMPFLAGEGRAIDWIGDYSGAKNIIFGVNAPRMMREIEIYLQTRNNWSEEETKRRVIYMPNYYPQDYVTKPLDTSKDTIDIGCFGALRPLKNHLLQAVAAIDFANKIGKKLNFHINAGRIEMNGGPVISNMKSLFEQVYDSGHRLINHTWRPREEFLQLCEKMDIGLQVSLSETFNIVGADYISQGVPIVSSDEIPWAVKCFTADPTSSEQITQKLMWAYKFPQINVWANQKALTFYTNKTARIWAKYFTN